MLHQSQEMKRSDIDLNDYVKKSSYEELQKQFVALTMKHDELKLKKKKTDGDLIKEQKKNQELLVENNMQKAKIRDLEEEIQELKMSQQQR